LTIQRKRVAKRLASGLLAGALALGGLAISGGSVSAKTPSSPSTNRIAGADRYETAVAIARNQLGAGKPTDGLVIASGEAPYDALAGAVLTTANRPMLLVRAGSVPEAVSDFVADYKSSWATGSKKVYVLGGESAISAEVFDAIKSAATTVGSLTPPVVTRISGADRYATAKAISEIAGVTAATDTMILANGENGRWADALSAAQISAEKGWPIITTTGAALNASAQAVIDAYIALPGSAKTFVIVGGPLVMGSAISDYLISQDVAPANIRVVGGADRYQTSLLVNLYAKNEVGIFAGASNVALVSGESPYDALVSAGWAATKNAHVMLTPSAGGNANVAALSQVLGGYADAGFTTFNDNLYVLGGKSAVADAAKSAYVAVSSANNLTATLTGCEKGRTSFTLTLSGGLAADATSDGASYSEVALVEEPANFGLTKNVTTAITDAGIKVKGFPNPTRQLFTITVASAPAVGDTIKWAGWTEGVALANGKTPERSIASASCTVTADSTPPTITLTSVPGLTTAGYVTTSAGAKILLSSSEAVDLGSLSNAQKSVTINGSTLSTGSMTATDMSGGAKTLYLLQYPVTATAPTATQTVEIQANYITDKAGNSPLVNPTATTIAADASLVATAAASSCTGTVKTVIKATATFTSDTKGASFNDYKVSVVNSRGLLVPSIAVDSTAKTITVTADVGYHTVADLKTAARNAGVMESDIGSWSIGGTTTDLLAATLAPKSYVSTGGTAGESDCTVLLSASEPFTGKTAGLTVNVAGLGAGYVKDSAVTYSSSLSTASPAGASPATDIAAAASTMSTAHTVTFTTKVLGAGTIVFADGDTGLQDTSGNNQLTAITFTAS